MHATLRRLSERVHTPLIHFLGKRQWPKEAGKPHAHPAAPPEFQKSFSDFLSKFEASASRSSPSDQRSSNNNNSGAYKEYWQAPTRLWNSRLRQLDETEIEAVLSGGASLR